MAIEWENSANKQDRFLKIITTLLYRYLKARRWTYITICVLDEKKDEPCYMSARAKCHELTVVDQYKFTGGQNGNKD